MAGGQPSLPDAWAAAATGAARATGATGAARTPAATHPAAPSFAPMLSPRAHQVTGYARGLNIGVTELKMGVSQRSGPGRGGTGNLAIRTTGGPVPAGICWSY